MVCMASKHDYMYESLTVTLFWQWHLVDRGPSSTEYNTPDRSRGRDAAGHGPRVGDHRTYGWRHV